MEPVHVVLIVVGLLIALICLGLPIAVSLGIAGLLGLTMLKDIQTGLVVLAAIPLEMSSTYALTVLPMFILMGVLASAAALSEKAFAVGLTWLGHVPGGLSVATMGAGAIFGAVCGSTVAAASALGKVAVPIMRKHGYDEGLAVGTVGAAGLLSGLIPPSLSMVIYATLTGESIGKMLISGILPGTITAILFSVTTIAMCLRNPGLAPKTPGARWKERLRSLLGISWIILLFIVIMGGIYMGVFTTTEAAGGGAFATLLIAIGMTFWGRCNWAQIREGFIESANTTVMIFALLICSGIFSFFLAMSGIPVMLAETIGSLAVPPIVILLAVCLLYIPLGMFLDPASMQVLILPIVYPLMISLGYDGIWFGVISVKMVEIGLLTPPVGLNVFVAAGVAKVPVETGFRGIAPFLATDFVALALVIGFPQISLWLPSMMK